MNHLYADLTVALVALSGILASMKVHKWGFWLDEASVNPTDTPFHGVSRPVALTTTPTPPSSSPYQWNTPENARHSVRVICDEEGLTPPEKNIVCAVVGGESEYYNYLPNGRPTTHPNVSSKTGKVTSTDWGICQINDRYHIGPHADFPSVDYVMGNPDKAVRWMVKMFKAGHINWWVAYNDGGYKKYLV